MIENLLKRPTRNLSAFISVISTIENQLNAAYKDLIETLQHRINSSQQLEIVRKKLNSIAELLPTAPRNLMDVTRFRKIEFSSEKYATLLEEIIRNFGDQISEIPIEVYQLVNITENPDFIFETLNVLCDVKQMDNYTQFTANLLQNLFRDESYLMFAFIKLSHNEIKDERWNEIEQYIQQLISVPDKIANRLKSSFPFIFEPDVYTAILMMNALKSIHVMTHINKVEQAKVYDFKFISKVISRVMTNFKSSTKAVNCTISILSTQATQNFYQNSIREVVKHLQRNASEIIIQHTFAKEKRKQVILKLFGEIWKSIPECYYFITKKIPLLTYSNDDLIIENIVFFYAVEDIKLMENIFMDMLNIWGSKSHVLDTSFEQHFYVTKFIVLMTSYLPSINDLSDKIRHLIFNGAQVHIGSTDVKLRALGMITSEIIVSMLDEGLKEEEKLKFDYSEFDESIMNSIVNVIRNYPTRKVLWENLEPFEVNDAEIEKYMNELIAISENKSSELTVKDDKIEQKITIKSSERVDIKSKTIKASVVKELDSDDDDDLQVYEDNEVVYDVNQPRYLLDIISALSTKDGLENPEVFQATMNSSQEIIKQQLAKSHSDIAIDLLRIFISLQKTCFCDNFERLRMNILVETCCTYPKECAQYICQEFNTEMTKYSMHTRMLMLDILSESAKCLSKLDIPNKDNENESTMKQQKYQGLNKLTIKLQEELNDRNKRDAQKIIQQRLLKKTRKIATRTKSINETSGINQFANYAGWFFFPIMQGFGKKQIVFSSKTILKNDMDNILLIKFLNTISIIMLCAENSTIALRMAKEIVNLSVFLRYHNEAKIRLAVLHMFATIILAVPKKILMNEFNNELNEFMNHLNMIAKSTVVNYEPDKDCREFAKELIKMCFNALYDDNDEQ
ncbi:hypothetical protein PVAND_004645 [Polypedilum vanderplanki]|uniref:Telomere length regulation protein conserved domain-containing protein n=1 Tax=Polypedilum vanderplanki TaxID=319348 RepID=A0A9J6BYQ9_POLVA|nr:hypothetical protein PVAND_004645 [Polypedilum vanderplanki]